jgi:hypothetical protein
MRRFFELRRSWPESYCSLRIGRALKSKVCHLDVYENPCDESYLQNYFISHYKPGHFPDVLPNNNGWFIVSSEFCRALNDTDAEAKAYTASIASILPTFCPDILRSYSLLSVARVVDCLDLSSPGLNWFDQTRNLVKNFDSLRFCKDKIPLGISFFGLMRVPCVFIISDAVRDNIINSKLTGVSFKECELV